MLDLKNAGLTELLHDFYTLTGLKLCIFDTDFEECASTPIKLYPLCARMRENPEFERRCHSCDTAHMQTCRRTRKPVQYRCHAGLTEYLAPLYYEGVIVAFICIGQATNGRDAELNTIAAYAAQFGIDEEECRSLYNMQLHYSPDEIKAACNILDACISHIYHQRMLEVRSLDTAQQIEKYINDNIAWDLSIEHLCAHFSVSRAELYQIFHTSFNSSVADYIRSKRISMAEQMIRSTSIQISEIASNVGFYDYNYFSKVFHRKFGCSPREYRKKTGERQRSGGQKIIFSDFVQKSLLPVRFFCYSRIEGTTYRLSVCMYVWTERSIQMNERAYYGHESQLFGVEEYRLTGGKGDGMRLLQVRNGKGLDFTVSADRCADISRLHFRGENCGFFSANGYVAPAYYDDKEAGWLKNFTAGFLTTCGLLAVGSPCTDEGVRLPLHGAVDNIPAERLLWDMDDERIWVKAVMRHAQIFAEKLILTRTITCSKQTNEITVTDEIENIGGEASPVMILYHMNMGYPLLSEAAELYIPAAEVTPRNAHAAEDLDTWNKVLTPTPGFEEQCYYHAFNGKPGLAAIFNHDRGYGLAISFDSSSLNCFTQWKMMGVKDYVMGLEPGNCYPDGRDVMREKGLLQMLAPGEKKAYGVRLTMLENEAQFEALKQK